MCRATRGGEATSDEDEHCFLVVVKGVEGKKGMMDVEGAGVCKEVSIRACICEKAMNGCDVEM